MLSLPAGGAPFKRQGTMRWNDSGCGHDTRPGNAPATDVPRGAMRWTRLAGRPTVLT
ncbi:MAG TPA: hypothetical protein VN800_06770 [Candidatus Acidoferrales bacterium]|nr:hypothetical protein [Candidatus Acidoferrales bacterium]